MNERIGQRMCALCTLLCLCVLLCCVNVSGAEMEKSFFANVESIPGSENLLEFHADSLVEGDYNDAQKLGGNLLQIRLYISRAICTVSDGGLSDYCAVFYMASPDAGGN